MSSSRLKRDEHRGATPFEARLEAVTLLVGIRILASASGTVRSWGQL
jgi:hypothetical protein